MRRMVLFAAVALACSDAYGPSDTPGMPGSQTPVATTSVTVVDNDYEPDYNAVSQGATVTWTWNGAVGHSVTFDDPSLADSPVRTSGTYQVTFPSAGTYDYYCTVHGRSVMSGRVLVQDPQQPPPGYP